MECGYARLTISNSNEYRVKDIAIRCNLLARSGTVLSGKTSTFYNFIEPNGTGRFEIEFVGINPQTESVNCQVTNASRA